MAHGNFGRGAISLALRVGTPLLGAFVLSSNCDGEGDCMGGVLLGAVLGVAGAIVLDAAVVAREAVPVQDSSGIAIGPVHVTPAVAAGKDQASFSLVGVF